MRITLFAAIQKKLVSSLCHVFLSYCQSCQAFCSSTLTTPHLQEYLSSHRNWLKQASSIIINRFSSTISTSHCLTQRNNLTINFLTLLLLSLKDDWLVQHLQYLLLVHPPAITGAVWGLAANLTSQLTAGTHPPLGVKIQPATFQLPATLSTSFVHLLPAPCPVLLYNNYTSWQSLKASIDSKNIYLLSRDTFTLNIL